VLFIFNRFKGYLDGKSNFFCLRNNKPKWVQIC